MGEHKGIGQSNTLFLWQDPRLYQIVSLSTLFLYGFFFPHFDTSIWQILITLGVAQLTQYAGTRYFTPPVFNPKNALISSLPWCLLFHSNNLAVTALAAFIVIGSKFVIRWKDELVFNPTNLELVVILASGLA